MGVITQGSRVHYWVTSFRVQVSDDKNSWKDVECGRIFDGNTDQNTKLTTYFDKPGQSMSLLKVFFSYPQLITLVCSEGPIHQNSCRNVVWPHLHARCCNTLRERLQGRFAGVYFPGNLGKASISVLSCYD